jgi:lysophospholipase L1-like esterase
MERTILCYGDSNTHGTAPMTSLEDRRRLGRLERWPGVLAAELGDGWHVIEEGLPGRTTVHPDPVEGEWKNGLAVLPAILDSHFPIDLVVLMLGTNDLKPRFQVPPVQIATSVERLLRVIRYSEAGPGNSAPRSLLIAPAPVVEEGSLAEVFAGGPARSQLAAPYAEAARRHGAAFLDAGGIWTVSPVDGVHFDAAEHAKLGRAVAAVVRDLVQEGRPC